MYCKIVKVEKHKSLIGDDVWILTHICGKVERRVARKRGTRHTKKAPNKVKCEPTNTSEVQDGK